MKWIVVIVLVIVGILAAIVAVEYFTVAIQHLPSFIPGRRHVRGHYRKRGAGAALIAFVAFVIAGVLAARIMRAQRTATAGPMAGESSTDILANPPNAPQGPAGE